MAHAAQVKIPATYIRGGTSKGVFFSLEELPESCRVPGPARDALLLRVIGSPDPYGKQIDGMGGATSSTSKTVILSKSDSPDRQGARGRPVSSRPLARRCAADSAWRRDPAPAPLNENEDVPGRLGPRRRT